ncbi:MAG: hypothetical protein ACOCYB_07420 [Alkalispirochaeta sp.]
MTHLPQRWQGIILRIVRGYYPHARLVAWGSMVDSGPHTAGPGDRLELAILDPADPNPVKLAAIRADLDASDVPVDIDLRPLSDLTLAEQEDALQRGEQFGG